MSEENLLTQDRLGNIESQLRCYSSDIQGYINRYNTILNTVSSDSERIRVLENLGSAPLDEVYDNLSNNIQIVVNKRNSLNGSVNN